MKASIPAKLPRVLFISEKKQIFNGHDMTVFGCLYIMKINKLLDSMCLGEIIHYNVMA